MLIEIKVIPRSSLNKIIEEEDGSLRVKLTSAPVDGLANKKLIELLADHYDVSKSQISIERGQTGKRKFIRIRTK